MEVGWHGMKWMKRKKISLFRMMKASKFQAQNSRVKVTKVHQKATTISNLQNTVKNH